MDKTRINLYDLLLCLSNAQDLISPALSNHHQQVAYLSFRLAEQMNLSVEQKKDVFLAALVHDIGALSIDERLDIIEKEPLSINNHAFKGAKLLKEFKSLQIVTDIIKFHHIPWNDGKGLVHRGEDVPFASHIIHLADRTCTKLQSSRSVLTQVPGILSTLNEEKNRMFEPSLLDALCELSKNEYIWLDLIAQSPITRIPDSGLFDVLVLEMDDMIELALMFSQIIDFRSRFTSRHSAGVAKTAEKLAELIGFSPKECKMMLIAGYLHDLGKLAVSNAVLEKQDKLNVDEFNEIRTHTYYTYYLLDAIPSFKTINTWASYHHEKLNGKGYPFHIKGDDLSIGSRIMAVADVFTAITENRPYRKGMENDPTMKVLNNMVATGSIDKKVVELLIDNFQAINDLRVQAQQDASERYERFMLTE